MRRWSIGWGAALLVLTSAANAQDAQTEGMPAIKIGVRDFQSTSAFYTALGMQSAARHNDHETSLSWGDPGQGSAIVMVRDESGRMVRGGAFMVFKVSNLAATLERLGRAGFAGFASPRTRLGYAMLTIRDPDGNQVELIDEIPLPAK